MISFLFRLGLLPAYQTFEIWHGAHLRSVRGFFGLMSYNDGLSTSFEKYLIKRGVLWRIRKHSRKLDVYHRRDVKIVEDSLSLPKLSLPTDYTKKLIADGYEIAIISTRNEGRIVEAAMYDPAQQVALLLVEDMALDRFGTISLRSNKYRHE